MKKVVRVSALDDYQLDVEFDDGIQGVISIKDRLFGPVFEPLQDRSVFGQVAIDQFGAICWPNGADLAPDAVYETLKGRKLVA